MQLTRKPLNRGYKDMQQHQERVIKRYRAVLAHGENMLRSARNGAWEDLITQQGDYVEVIEELAELEQYAQLDAAGREAKFGLLTQIRDNEYDLREMLQSRMNELSGLMAQSRTQLRVHEAYEPNTARG